MYMKYMYEMNKINKIFSHKFRMNWMKSICANLWLQACTILKFKPIQSLVIVLILSVDLNINKLFISIIFIWLSSFLNFEPVWTAKWLLILQFYILWVLLLFIGLLIIISSFWLIYSVFDLVQLVFLVWL